VTGSVSGRRRLFDDDPRHLDRFGALLVLSSLAVAVNMLVDLEDPTSSWTNELGWLFVTVVTGATLVLAANASGVSLRWRRVIAILVGVVVLLAAAVSLGSLLGSDAEVVSGRPNLAWVLIATATPLFVLRRIFNHERVTGQTIAGAVSVFLLIPLAFSYLFGLADQWGSTPFFGTEQPTTAFMYFSLVTVTTLGYGDLSPTTEFARLLATTEAVIGQIFLVVVVARLVSLFGTGASPGLAESPTHDTDHDS
jgi:hypothetical protein